MHVQTTARFLWRHNLGIRVFVFLYLAANCVLFARFFWGTRAHQPNSQMQCFPTQYSVLSCACLCLAARCDLPGLL